MGISHHDRGGGFLCCHAGYAVLQSGSVVILYWYWSGIYHLFDSFGKWYGIGKCGNGIGKVLIV